MNRLPLPSEITARRPEWVEGEWVTLADGQAWNFPPPAACPGHQEEADRIAKEVVDNILPLLNIDAIRRAGLAAAEGDPSAVIRGLAQMFAIYQAAFRAGSALLRRNYDLAESDCDRLMPFNYQLSDLADPQSRLHQATPEVLASCNAVAKASGVNIGPELARIAGSN